MEEAVEICKLRLFLKLISQVERQDDLPNFGIEPLPDIDFNILSGNTLVGFAKLEDIEKVFSSRENGEFNFWIKELEQIQKHAIEIEILHDEFIKRQLVINQFAAQTVGQASNLKKNNTVDSTNEAETVTSLKEMIKQKNEELNEKLNLYLAKVYGVNTDKPKDYQNWKESHKPFHWVTEFYSILKNGGFDVIIGNPPYVEYSKVKKEYAILDYETEECGNLYAYIMERSLNIVQSFSRVGLIIPLSFISTDGFFKLRELYFKFKIWSSNYAIRPAKLFEGVEHRLSICIVDRSKEFSLMITKYRKWSQIERTYLLNNLSYQDVSVLSNADGAPKLNSSIEYSIWKKFKDASDLRFIDILSDKTTEYKFYYTRKFGHYVVFTDFIPLIKLEKENKIMNPTELKFECLPTQEDLLSSLAFFNSGLIYWYLTKISDCRNLNKRDILNMPFKKFEKKIKLKLIDLSKQNMKDFRENASHIQMNYPNQPMRTIEVIHPGLAKEPIIDEIDKVLASHYGFTEEELDYIINYDIKYRMGKELNEDE